MMIFPTTKLIHDLTWAPWSWEERAFLSRASGQVLSKYQYPCRTGPPWSDEEEIDALWSVDDDEEDGGGVLYLLSVII